MLLLAVGTMGGCIGESDSCQRSRRRVYITWFDFNGDDRNDPADARYVWNAEHIGSGTEGMCAILRRLILLEPATEIYVFPDAIQMNVPDGCGPVPYYNDSVPYRRYPRFVSRMRAIVHQQGLSVLYTPDIPGMWVNADDMSFTGRPEGVSYPTVQSLPKPHLPFVRHDDCE